MSLIFSYIVWLEDNNFTHAAGGAVGWFNELTDYLIDYLNNQAPVAPGGPNSEFPPAADPADPDDASDGASVGASNGAPDDASDGAPAGASDGASAGASDGAPGKRSDGAPDGASDDPPPMTRALTNGGYVYPSYGDNSNKSNKRSPPAVTPFSTGGGGCASPVETE